MDSNFGSNFASGLLAGVTAAVIWTSICLVFGMETRSVGIWALIFLVVGTVGTTLIATMISKSKLAQRS